MSTHLMRKALHLLCWLWLVSDASAEESTDFWQAFRLGGYTSSDLRIPRTQTAQLILNQISLITTWDQGGRIKFFSELELENPLLLDTMDGLQGRHGKLDLERLYLDGNLNEYATLRVGRFLTPAGRWNQLHAPPLVWTASRPLVTLRMFPNGLNGAMIHGSVPVMEAGLDYQLYVEALKDQEKDGPEVLYKDMRGGRLAFNHLLWSGGDNSGLNVLGLNVISYRKDQPGAPTYRLYGLDFLLERNRWEFSGEAFFRTTANGAAAGNGFYLQSAYALPNQWYLISRIEALHEVDSQNADRWVLGLTKRLKPNQLLKFELIGGSGAYQDVPRGFVSSFAMMF